MVKGGKDNRNQRQQRRRQRPKVFHRPNAATNTDVHDADASRQNEEVIESEPYRQNEGVVDSVVADADQTQDDTTNIMEDDSPHTTIPDETVSQSKVEPIPLPINELLSGYRLIDINILSVLFKHVSCSICKAVGLLLCQKQKHGLAFTFTLSCSECDWQYEFCSSPKKSKMFDINYKTVYSMRRCGKGYQGLQKFLALINHPPPMTEKNYRMINLKFSNAVRDVAMRSMDEAAEEVRQTQTSNKDLIVETGVSVDGTWQRRGFSSLNGAVAALSIDS